MMHAWMGHINHIAATESGAPLRMPVSSFKGRFQHPTLPESRTTGALLLMASYDYNYRKKITLFMEKMNINIRTACN
jgi:hypothetical protein